MICPKCDTEYDRGWGSVMLDCPNCSAVDKQTRMDWFYMDVAIRASELSHAVRTKVGSVLVKDDNILAFGWNGMPAGFDNCCEVDPDTTKDEVIHAEMNVFAKVARSTGNALDGTLYVTLSPCFECCKLIIQAGITRVVYLEKYRNVLPIEFIKDAGIEVVQLVK